MRRLRRWNKRDFRRKTGGSGGIPRAGLVARSGAVTASGMRWLALATIAAAMAADLWADRALDLARIHVEAIGGRGRIEKLTALRATGQAMAAGRQVRFTMLAARPNKVRLETEAGGRTLVQGYDGESPPWEFDTGTWPPQYRAMAEANAKLFAADAEFDDPLIAGAAGGYALDYAGEVTVDGKKLLRLLVTRRLSETFSLYLDEETYFIVMKVESRVTAGGRRTPVVTHYHDFRPVEGVLLPHQISISFDGKLTQQTRIARIDGNPTLAADAFSRPAGANPAGKGSAAGRNGN